MVKTSFIRQAVENDIAELTNLLKNLFTIEEDFQCSSELQQQGLNLLLNSPGAAIIVAEDDSGVIGMITGQILISTAEGGPSLHIEDLYVQQQARGKGVGKRLLEAIGKWGFSHGARRMQLLADKNNYDGLGFYAHSGWQQTQLICLRSYFKNGEK
ncbi:MAG: GNAT family N-acetyltransferase [Desulfocapsaceae bacterium]|nr:GNAT family N-acetyltransferase [Desulfocapsaceae bacterium]